MAFHSGNGGTVLNGAVVFPVSEWDAEVKGDKLDTTNAVDAGIKTSKIGPLELNGSCKGYWDKTLNSNSPYDALKPQEGVSFTLNQGTDGGAFTFTGNIESLKITTSNTGVVEFAVTFCSTSSVGWSA